jgi:hypothetical protein
MLGLELGELAPGRLPFLAGSDLVLGHLMYLLPDSSVSVGAEADRRIRRYRDH